MTNKENMYIEISGNKLPLIAIILGCSAIFSAIMYSTIWLTKLDNRVLDNNSEIAKNRIMIERQSAVMTLLQSNCQKQTHILNTLVDKVNKEYK